MGKLGRVSAICALLFACGKGDGARGAGEAANLEGLERVALQKLAQPVDPRFDERGKLKPSGQRFAWFELPMGFEKVAGGTEQSAAFDASDMPYQVVREYLDERLVPQKLELGNRSLHFMRATPSYTQLTMDPLNASLFEVDPEQRTVRLHLDALTRTETPLTMDAAKELLARERQRIQ